MLKSSPASLSRSQIEQLLKAESLSDEHLDQLLSWEPARPVGRASVVYVALHELHRLMKAANGRTLYTLGSNPRTPIAQRARRIQALLDKHALIVREWIEGLDIDSGPLSRCLDAQHETWLPRRRREDLLLTAMDYLERAILRARARRKSRQADSKADNKKYSGVVTPANPLVAQLAHRINKTARDHALRRGEKTEIARVFLSEQGIPAQDREHEAKSLLRQLRRFPNLLNSEANKADKRTTDLTP
jgi:hypothetical protein